jgi:hypothetical protein
MLLQSPCPLKDMSTSPEPVDVYWKSLEAKGVPPYVVQQSPFARGSSDKRM